jgi:hypothetical protein
VSGTRAIPLRFTAENEPRLQVGRSQVSLVPFVEAGRIELKVEHLWERLWR